MSCLAFRIVQRLYGNFWKCLKELRHGLLIHIQRIHVDTSNADAREALFFILGSCRKAQPGTKQLHRSMRYCDFCDREFFPRN
jgi:hypothetical protein